MNWYVIQVKSGREKEIANKCSSLIPKKILEECFIPQYIVKKKIKGEWRDVKNILFSGYVFLISNQIDELFIELKKLPDFTKIVGKKRK